MPSWSCLWADVQIAFAGPNQACWKECTSWSGDPCSGYSSCYNKNISCNGGVDQDGRNCSGCCFSCKTVCDDPDLPPTFTQTDLTCSQNGLNGWCVGTQSLDLTATESKGRNILISGDLPGDTFTCTEQASPASCSISLPEGSGGINYTAMSSIGLSSSGSTSWKRDATLPNIEGTATGTSGSNNWFVSNVEVSATVTETGSGLNSFETSPDGSTWTAYTAPLTFTEGMHNLQLRAIDVAGNQADTSVSLQVDTTVPAISGSLSGTLGGGNWYTSNVEASATASDATSGIASIEYNADGSGWQAYSAPVDFSDGSHTIQFRTYDAAGWSAETETFSFQVDTTGPHIKLPSRWYIWETGETIIKDDSSKVASVTIIISDPQGRWKKVKWHWTPDTHQFLHTISWNRVFADGVTAPIGTYNVSVIAVDNAGNSSEKTAQIIIPQADAPALPTFTPTPIPAVIVAEETAPPPETEEVVVIPPAVDPEPSEGIVRKEISISFSSPKTEPISEQSSNLPLAVTAAAALGASLAVTRNKKKEKQASGRVQVFGKAKQVPVPANAQGSATITSAQPASSNVLWGSAASSVIGAFTARIEEEKRRLEEERQRRKAEEEAKRARKKAEAEERERLRRLSSAENQSGGVRLTKRQKLFERMGWSKPKKLSYRERAKAYQRSLDTFRANLKASGLSADEVAKQSSNAIRNGKIPSAAAVIENYRQEKRLKAKDEFLNPSPPATPEPSLAEVQKRMALKAQKDASVDSAMASYIAMGNAVEDGEFSKEEYDKAQLDFEPKNTLPTQGKVPGLASLTAQGGKGGEKDKFSTKDGTSSKARPEPTATPVPYNNTAGQNNVIAIYGLIGEQDKGNGFLYPLFLGSGNNSNCTILTNTVNLIVGNTIPIPDYDKDHTGFNFSNPNFWRTAETYRAHSAQNGEFCFTFNNSKFNGLELEPFAVQQEIQRLNNEIGGKVFIEGGTLYTTPVDILDDVGLTLIFQDAPYPPIEFRHPTFPGHSSIILTGGTNPTLAEMSGPGYYQKNESGDFIGVLQENGYVDSDNIYHPGSYYWSPEKNDLILIRPLFSEDVPSKTVVTYDNGTFEEEHRLLSMSIVPAQSIMPEDLHHFGFDSNTQWIETPNLSNPDQKCYVTGMSQDAFVEFEYCPPEGVSMPAGPNVLPISTPSPTPTP